MFFTRAQASISVDRYLRRSGLNLDKFKYLMSREIDDTLRNCIVNLIN